MSHEVNEKSTLKKLQDDVKILTEQKNLEELKNQIAEQQLKSIKSRTDAELSLKKSQAEAQRDLKKIQLEQDQITIPSGEGKPLSGEITTDDNFGYFSEILAYESLKECAKDAASQINASGIDSARILIVDHMNVLQDDLPLLQINQQLSSYQKTFTTQIETNNTLRRRLTIESSPEPNLIDALESVHMPEELFQLSPTPTLDQISTLSPTLSLAHGTLSALVDIAGFFKSNYSIKSKKIEITTRSLTAAIAKDINAQVYTSDLRKMQNSKLLKKFTDTLDSSTKLKQTKANLEHLAKDDTFSAHANTLAKEIQNTLTLVEEFVAFKDAITSTCEKSDNNDETTPSLLHQAVLRESIDTLDITHLLYLEVISSAGEAMTIKKAFTSGHVGFLAGSVITYLLTDITGKIISSDTLTSSTKWDYKLDGTYRSKSSKVKNYGE
jgi:hypothetical protein